MAQTVIGFFDNRNEAERAVEQLTNAGISRDRIDISSGRSGSTTTGVSYSDGDRDRDHESGITRFFRNLFGDDDDEADRYSRVANTSDCIVTVHAQSDSEASRAADLLDEYGAIDVDERSNRLGAVSDSRSDRSDFSDDRSESIPVIREELNVDKRMEDRGSVRVRSRIVERPVEEHVRLREEHVRVERNPVDRPVSSSDMGAFREGEIELTERAEVPVVNKEARVVEEVRLSKETTERDETIRDTVRNTDVDVDQDNTNRSTDLRNDINRTGNDISRTGNDLNRTGSDMNRTGSDINRTDSDISRMGNDRNSGLLRDNDLRGDDYRDTDDLNRNDLNRSL